jgi:hypothetical protein
MSSIVHNNLNMSVLLKRLRLQRGLVFGILIIAALFAFEVFNYSTTDFALGDLLGNLKFAGVRWATILAIAFCGIDFAGIARLFTPEEGDDEPKEVWYLFGAWLLAATMNAMLTWWAVSLAILGHDTLGNAVVARPMLLRMVPIFVAVIVWLIRILIIGTFSVAGDRLFSQANTRAYSAFPGVRASTVRTLGNNAHPVTNSNRINSAPSTSSFRSVQKSSGPIEGTYSRPEPTYHSVSMRSTQDKGNGQTR